MADRATHQNPVHCHAAWAKYVDGKVLIKVSHSVPVVEIVLDVTAFAEALARDIIIADVERGANMEEE